MSFLPALRRASTSVLLIASIALLFRVSLAWDYMRHRPRQALSLIPFLFESGNIAHSVATGKGFSSPFRVDTGPTAWTTPVYPLLLAGVMRMFGPYSFPSYVAAVAMNILFSVFTCVPLFFAGKRIGGVAVGAAAAWLWAIFPNAILLSFESLWETCLAGLLGASILWATLRVSGSVRTPAWCAYGLLWGAALMTNATLLSLSLLLLGWAVYRGFQGGPPARRTLPRNAALAAAVTVACCIPWTIRNYAVFHTFIPLRSILGLQLWVGNNPHAKVIWLGEQHPIHDSVEREKYVEMGEVAYMRQKERDAIQYMLAHPSHEAALVFGRFISLWSGGTPSPVRDFFRSRSTWFRYVLLFNVGAAFGTLLGLVFLVRERSPYLFPVAVYPVVYPFAYYLTLSLPRYRHAIDPVVMLLSAVTLMHLARQGLRSAHLCRRFTGLTTRNLRIYNRCSLFRV